MSILQQIKKHKMTMFRRLFIRRRIVSASNEYEADWVQIATDDIVKFGTVKISVDDVIPAFFKYGGLTFELLNDEGKYSSITDDKSLFFGATSITRTLVKLEAGYQDSTGTEFPTDPTLFIGLITDNPTFTESSRVRFRTKHLTGILDETPSDRIGGLGAAGSVGSILALIKNYTDGSANLVHQKFISSGAWNIPSTSSKTYNMATTTNLQNKSAWKLMQQLAVAEDSVVYMDRIGSLFFQDKDSVSSASQFHFSGIGDSDKTSGHNISKQISVVEDIKNVFNRIKVQYETATDNQTTTASSVERFKIANESFVWGDSSSSFTYGVREFKYKNTFLDSTAAGALTTELLAIHKDPKTRVDMVTKFVPHLAVLDRVTVTYKTRQAKGSGALWGAAVFGVDVWGERLGFNIEIDNQASKIMRLEHNVDNFTSKVRVKSV